MNAVRLTLALLFVYGSASAQATDADFIDRKDAAHVTGEQIFTHVCQGCHMPDAKGAVGAGRYPALAGNPKLASAAYPAAMVINGRGGMPPFGMLLSDAQVADVVNYVRTHFGNTYQDALTAEDVKAFRPAPHPEEH
ncbi:c-type cytochrome [Luteibacter sp. UNCMF366Tsu5.1]|uniref:c-type cytochrome n=1 Tax=Luteibacter sp. UNCMF366Tsu5.1 TaxID=1502758 RepID=UPI0009089818|nr:cytochrome c [Luteibacter sp. UNCMF366Tsu5.1]SFW39623.1 Cytochrome C oxidase, cbb3-type, subunit III [Luteibacter sp. UNCMF366Tsu5.1]